MSEIGPQTSNAHRPQTSHARKQGRKTRRVSRHWTSGLRAAIAIASLAAIASFWFNWLVVFNEPIRGSDFCRMLSHLPSIRKVLPPWAPFIPFVPLFLGVSGALWSYLICKRRSRRAASAIIGLVTVLSALVVFFASYLAWVRSFWLCCGPGFWLAYLASAVLLVLALCSVFPPLARTLKTLFDLLAYGLLRLVVLVFTALPRNTSIKVGITLARAVFHLMPKRKEIALRNLWLVFGDELSPMERYRIARLSFLNLGRLVAEFCRLPKLISTPAQELFTHENLEVVKRAVARGKGLILLTGHFGCWELSPLAMAQAGFRMTALARPLDNPFLDRWVNRRRRMAGTEVIARRQGIRELASVLRAGGIVAVLFDQSVQPKECVFAPLSGRNVATSPLPAMLARRTGAEVVFGAGIPCPNGRYKIVFSEPIPTSQEADFQRFVTANTSAYNAMLDRFIRQYPQTWLWVHNRWKETQASVGLWDRRRVKRENY